MRQNPHVRICGGPGSATTLVYPTATQYEDLEKGWHGGPPIRTSACPTFILPARRISCEETSWRY